MGLPETSIIGIGGLGTALTQTFFEKKVLVKSIYNRTEKKAREFAESSSVETYGAFPSKLDDLGELIFITVSDDAIEEIAGHLSQLKGDFKVRTFVHCSGNESADILQPLKDKGAYVASFHPLQTFTSLANSDDFKNIYFSMQGDAETFPLLKKIAQRLDADAFKVNEEQKSHLHVAAVMASNYMTTLLDASVEIGTLSGLSDKQVKDALMPLVRTTVNNNELHSFAEVLTGPIKRGDIQTVEKHLSLLEDKAELRDLYCLLGLKTMELFQTTGNADKTTVEKMREILLE